VTHLAVAVPAAPAIAWGLLDLALAIAFVVSLGLLWSWKRTIGAAFVWLGNKSISFSIHGVGAKVAPFGFLLGLNETIIKYLGEAAAASENAMAYAFHRMVGSIIWTGQEIAGLATDTYNAIRHVEHTAVTHVTKVIRQTVVKPIHTTVTVTKGIGASVAKQLTARVKALEHKVARLTHAAGHAIATPFPRIGQLERSVKGQAKRITKLEKLLAAGVGVALLTKALTKVGVNYIRCDRNKQLGKGICKTDPSWVTEFLAGSILLLGTTSFHDFVEEAQEGFNLGLEGLQLFIREFQSLDIPKS
jgi:hypothetical protein